MNTCRITGRQYYQGHCFIHIMQPIKLLKRQIGSFSEKKSALNLNELNVTKMLTTGIILFLFVVTGIAICGQVLIREEKDLKINDLLDRGGYLTSLIALHPTKDLKGKKQDFFLRILSEYLEPASRFAAGSVETTVIIAGTADLTTRFQRAPSLTTQCARD